ncbi:hypothetical protein Nepgr_022052 [Nepenthes gracilis]|uniref:Uncharacterized protein n=1 Tax=Nepenthes gracilis TaxID=150966 RepID=A0AAD3T1Y0_NEPGR|nr:hypothetical protein Nepgr_022052 [Nepenthes gracilis]
MQRKKLQETVESPNRIRRWRGEEFAKAEEEALGNSGNGHSRDVRLNETWPPFPRVQGSSSAGVRNQRVYFYGFKGRPGPEKSEGIFLWVQGRPALV